MHVSVPTSASGQAPAAAAYVTDRATYTADSASAYVIRGQTLGPGSMITLHPGPFETVASLVMDGTREPVLVVSGGEGPALSVAFGGQIFSSNDVGQIFTSNDEGVYVVGDQTLMSAGIVTLNPSPFQTVVALTTETAGEPLVVVNSGAGLAPSIAFESEIVTINDAGTYVVGETLTSGSTFALAPTADAAGAPPPVGLMPLVIGGTTYEPNTMSAYVVDGQTLTVGGSIVLSAAGSTSIIVLTTDTAGSGGDSGSGDFVVIAGELTPTTTAGESEVTAGEAESETSLFEGAAAGSTLSWGLGWKGDLFGVWAGVALVLLGTVVVL